MRDRQSNVIDFLRLVASREDVLATLRTRPKDDVIAAAADFDLPFTGDDFDAQVWDLEVRLAGARGEPFDAGFPLWQTMWGQYYLEYLVTDLIPSLDEAGLTTRQGVHHSGDL